MAPTHVGRGGWLLLPRAANTVDKPDRQTYELTVVAIDAANGMHVNGIRVRYADVAAKVNESLEGKTARTVLLIGDQDARYSAVMAAMDCLRAVEVVDVGLVVEPREDRSAGAGADQR
jgi:biopolymer transport protein ExbD